MVVTVCVSEGLDERVNLQAWSPNPCTLNVADGMVKLMVCPVSSITAVELSIITDRISAWKVTTMAFEDEFLG